MAHKPKMFTTKWKKFANLWIRVFHLYKTDNSANDSCLINNGNECFVIETEIDSQRL